MSPAAAAKIAMLHTVPSLAAPLAELAAKVDVVVLAQASMARIVTVAAAEVPVLSSLRSGIAQLAL